jgi:hypothetical protein
MPLLLAAAALSAAACARVHAYCDPQLDRLAAHDETATVLQALEACEKRLMMQCRDAACQAAGHRDCDGPYRQHQQRLSIPQDPSFNADLCRSLLTRCP